MTYLKWFCMSLLSLFCTVLGFFVVPIVLLFGVERSPFPWFVSWFDNVREPFGDIKRKAEYDAQTTWWGKFKCRWYWLAKRNPVNVLGFLCGFPQQPNVEYFYSGDPLTSDQGRAGNLVVRAMAIDVFHTDRGEDVTTRTLAAFEWYFVWVWPFAKNHCIRIRMGWKLSQNVSPHPEHHVTDGTRAEIVHSVNPFDTFTHEAG